MPPLHAVPAVVALDSKPLLSAMTLFHQEKRNGLREMTEIARSMRTLRTTGGASNVGLNTRTLAEVAAKKPFKIEDDGRGFADKLFEVLEPYIPVQVVPSGDAADLKVVWKEKNSPAKFLGFICDTRGLTIEWPFDTANPTRSFPQMIKEVLDELLVNEGKPKRCDAGYRYSGIEEISCCTAELLNTLDLSCSKGKKVNNPPCWSPPVTTPVSGKTKLVKVKILVNPQVKKRDWTEEKSLQELENANRLIAATSGIEDSVRFVMHGQNMERLILGTEAADVFDKLQVVAEAHPDEYDVLLYLTNQKTINEKGQQIGGRAEQGLCLADRPSVAYADPLGSYITVTHELAHVLGADHGQFGCTFPMIARSAINGFPDKDLGLTQCSANRIANELPKYTCLETAP